MLRTVAVTAVEPQTGQASQVARTRCDLNAVQLQQRLLVGCAVDDPPPDVHYRLRHVGNQLTPAYFETQGAEPLFDESRIDSLASVTSCFEPRWNYRSHPE